MQIPNAHTVLTLLSFCGGPGALGVPDADATVPLPFPVFDPNELDDASDKDGVFELFVLKIEKKNNYIIFI